MERYQAQMKLTKFSPKDGVIGQFAEALAHTRCATQILLQQVRKDL